MAASIFGLVTFILGGFGGFAIYHYFFRLSNQERKLLDELQQVQQEFKDYQYKVAADLKESVGLIDQVQESSRQLHDHILHSSVRLNLASHKQSILQPVLHREGAHDELHEDEQVTEFHPTHSVVVKHAVTPPRDYV